MTDLVDSARAAFARQMWADAYELLGRLDSPDVDDLERLAVAAYLVGQDEVSSRAWERAHLERVHLGDFAGSARCAGWLVISLMLRGDIGQASGWRARAIRVLDDAGCDCAGRGLLRAPEFLEKLGGGDALAADRVAVDIVDLARRYNDRDVLALGVLGRGQAAFMRGDAAGGMALLDEVMVGVAAGEVSPIPAGIVYCAVIELCMDVSDLRRATEWTDALSNWCAAQPGLVPYRGQCLVHRSQVLQAHGEWGRASAEAAEATARLSDPVHPALGLAKYQQGELHRLRGDVTEAERAYRLASEHGHEPAPGLALLRLQEGNVEAAAASIRRMVDESRGRLTQGSMLGASVEIMLANGNTEAARSDAEELDRIAVSINTALLDAVAAYAGGSVRLAIDDATAALASFRRAHNAWRELAMPYDVARAHVQIGLACRALGDADAAGLEFDAARVAFARLGADPDVARTDRLVAQETAAPPAQLTGRECEVLRLVATGMTNREIAGELVISEHTVGRHVQNIFMKLGLSSRAAATAFAYEHFLV